MESTLKWQYNEDKVSYIYENQQSKLPWCWRYRMFYIYAGNICVELKLLYTKRGQHFFEKPQNIEETPILKVTVKNKVNFQMTVQTGILTY